MLALCLGYLFELLVHGVISAAYPYDLNYGEGYVVNDGLRLVRGEPIWTDADQFPMVRSPYPPGYLLLVGILTAPHPSLLPARVVSLVATLVIAGLLLCHARQWTAPVSIAAAAGGFWVGSTFVYQWAPLARVDLLGLAFCLGAVVLVSQGATNRRLALAAGLCALALLTKQTYIAAPIAIALCLALQRDLRAIWFALGAAIPVAVVTVALAVATEGRYVEHVLVGNAANSFEPGKLLALCGLFATLNGPALLLAAGAVWWTIRRTGPYVQAIYVPLALASIVTVGNTAGDVNYFLEATAALGLAVPIAWTGVGHRRWMVALLAFVQLLLLVHIPNGFMSQVPEGPAKGSTPSAEDVRIGDEVLAIVRTAGSRALVEPAGLAVVAQTPVWIQPVDLQGDQRLGRWSPDLLVRSLEEQWWEVVVLDYQFLPLEAMATLERAYELERGLSSPNGLSYFIYRPRR